MTSQSRSQSRSHEDINGKRSLCLIVLTPFCLVEEIRARISCQKQRLGKNNIVFHSAGHMTKIEDVLPKNNEMKDL